MININCPKCQRTQPDENELYKHLRDVHKLSPEEIKRLGIISGSGWHEPQQNTPNGKIAIDHQEAALRAQMAKEKPLSLPMVVAPPPKQGIKIPKGWTEGADGGYNFEQVISEKHTTENLITKIVRGQVTANHAILTEYTYDKNIAQLSELQDKASILEARLTGYTIADPEFVMLVNQAHDQRHKVSELKKDLKPEVYTDTTLEDYFRGEQGSEEHTKWKEDLMQKIIEEAERLSKKPATGDEVI